jgi:N,N-dimethylformamidase
MTDAKTIPLIGYADTLSGRPGDRIDFKVSSDATGPYSARLVRIISADPNPAGQGIVEQDVTSDIAGTYPSRVQAFHPGSYVAIDQPLPDTSTHARRFEATIWPTMPGHGRQIVLAAGELALGLDESGRLAAWAGEQEVATTTPLETRKWYRVWLSLDYTAGKLDVGYQQIKAPRMRETHSTLIQDIIFGGGAHPVIAARMSGGLAVDHFNGKIEAPAIYASQDFHEGHVLARWDFARAISSTRIEDTGPHGLDGRLVNLPARAMTGAAWDGSEMCWRHKPEHYAAIHFHENDIYDFGWETDFSLTIPEDLPSGIYAARISCDGHEDAMPFFVLPPRGKRTADLCVLVSTFTYIVYGNHARPDYTPEWDKVFAEWGCYPYNPAAYKHYGLSTYNYHKDGSGICHASHRRPLFNMKPGYRTFPYGEGSGHRHFQADSHLISWLHHAGIAYDIVTDQELHDEGLDAIKGYKVVTTGSHPEYHTKATLDALQSYRDTGGRLAYLGGNGFYWRVALHPENNGAIEIRRAETGIRAWAAEPGEYYNAFDGQYGGIWRRNGRPPQMLAGVGFSAQGQFEGSYYRRKIDVSDPQLGWIVEGIADDKIGDFGFSGGGAAGFELDRADVRLGTPANARVIASSEGHGESFVLVPEEQLTHITNWPGEPQEALLRADMIYYDVPGGGAVFSTGSITFCGSLPWNNFDNNVSRLLGNVFARWLE